MRRFYGQAVCGGRLAMAMALLWPVLAGAQPVFIETIGSSGSGAGQFSKPSALAFDSSGALYVADTNNDRIQKFDLINGAYVHAYSVGSDGDGDGQFRNVVSIAVDAAGNVYAGDDQRANIQKFVPAGPSLAHAFTFTPGIAKPIDLAFDSAGDLYVADYDLNHVNVYTPGPATLTLDATFTASGAIIQPTGVHVAGDGTVYVVDRFNKKLYTGFRLGNIIGVTDTETLSGATEPSDVALAADGSIFVTGKSISTINKYGYNGTSITSQLTFGSTGSALVNAPEDIVVDRFGTLIATGTDNDVLRRWFDPSALAPGNTATLANLTIGNLGNTLTLAAGKSVQVVGTTVVEPGGTMTVQSEQFTTANLGVFGGSYNGKLAGVGALTFLSGTLTVTDAAGLTVGSNSPTGALLTISTTKTLNVTQTLTVDPTGTIEFTGGAASAGSLVNNGTLNASGATLTLSNADSVNNGPINLTAGGLRLTKAMTNNALVTATDSAFRVDGAFINSASGQISLTGFSTLRFDSGATNDGQINFDGADVIFSGSITNAAGTVNLINNALVSMNATVDNNGVISVEAGSSIIFDKAYSGTGTITGSGLSTFTSSVKPGGDVAASMSVAGDADLQGTLTIQIGGASPGTAYDQLLIGGSATLGGGLTIELINGYKPLGGEAFVIIDAASGVVDNAFTQIDGLTISPGNLFELIYDEALDQVRLVAPVLLLADTDSDGDIDDSDLGTIFANYTGPVGQAGAMTAAQGDTDGDGDVDDSDLGTAFAGYTGPLSPSNVPEPASVLALMSGFALISRSRCAGRRCAPGRASVRGGLRACRSAT